MDFEWDPLKSASNFAKHGISFDEAVLLWTSPTLEIDEIARTQNDETRGATIGVVSGILYTAIWTKRHGFIRLISVRKARHGETKAYYKKNPEELGDNGL